MRVLNIGLVAHVDAGKTTTAEQMLYRSGSIKDLGNVNKGTTLLDYNQVERDRGITIFADQAELQWKDCTINLIDTPGHVDFISEMERSLAILDGAILIISAPEGIQSHTETIWNTLRLHNIPTLLFVNKMDRLGIDLPKLKRDIETLVKKPLYLQEPMNTGKEFEGLKTLYSPSIVDDQAMESIVEADEKLLEAYLDNQKIPTSDVEQAFKKAIKTNKLAPICFGCASQGTGINELLDYTISLFSSYDGKVEEDFKAYVYKVKMDENIGKLTYIKVLQGNIKVRDSFLYQGEEVKVTGLRKYKGSRYERVQQLLPGQLGILCGLKNSKIGDYLGVDTHKSFAYESNSVLKTSLIYDDNNIEELVHCMHILNEEDPSLNVQWLHEQKEIVISVMGIIQMEVLKEIIRQRFQIEVDFHEPSVHYKETVLSESTGFCHFEPKKHFAEVEVFIEPLTRGAGWQFESNVRVDDLPIQFQNLIEDNAFDALKHGVLLGAPVTDIKVILVAGKYHQEHTHGGDFRIATIRAIQQALSKNQCGILEPYYSFKIMVDRELSGKIMADMIQMKGELSEPIIIDDKIQLRGIVPIATSMNYPIKLASQTGGKAAISLRFHGYRECHNQDEVLEDKNNYVERDEKLYNSITLLRHKKKMKKVE